MSGTFLCSSPKRSIHRSSQSMTTAPYTNQDYNKKDKYANYWQSDSSCFLSSRRNWAILFWCSVISTLRNASQKSRPGHSYHQSTSATAVSTLKCQIYSSTQPRLHASLNYRLFQDCLWYFEHGDCVSSDRNSWSSKAQTGRYPNLGHLTSIAT